MRSERALPIRQSALLAMPYCLGASIVLTNALFVFWPTESIKDVVQAVVVAQVAVAVQLGFGLANNISTETGVVSRLLQIHPVSKRWLSLIITGVVTEIIFVLPLTAHYFPLFSWMETVVYGILAVIWGLWFAPGWYSECLKQAYRLEQPPDAVR